MIANTERKAKARQITRYKQTKEEKPKEKKVKQYQIIRFNKKYIKIKFCL